MTILGHAGLFFNVKNQLSSSNQETESDGMDGQ